MKLSNLNRLGTWKGKSILMNHQHPYLFYSKVNDFFYHIVRTSIEFSIFSFVAESMTKQYRFQHKPIQSIKLRKNQPIHKNSSIMRYVCAAIFINELGFKLWLRLTMSIIFNIPLARHKQRHFQMILRLQWMKRNWLNRFVCYQPSWKLKSNLEQRIFSNFNQTKQPKFLT